MKKRETIRMKHSMIGQGKGIKRTEKWKTMDDKAKIRQTEKLLTRSRCKGKIEVKGRECEKRGKKKGKWKTKGK